MGLAHFILNIKTQVGHCHSALRTASHKQEDPESTVSHVIRKVPGNKLVSPPQGLAKLGERSCLLSLCQLWLSLSSFSHGSKFQLDLLRFLVLEYKLHTQFLI